MERGYILLVEGDKEIREGMEIFLKSQGYVVFQTANGIEGPEMLEREEAQLATVDIMVSRMDDITMTARLRENYDFSTIFLSAKSEEMDRVLGLNIGADDHITKPFTLMELMTGVNSQLRRCRRFMDQLGSTKETNSRIHHLGGLEINEETVKVLVDKRPAKVTPIEFEILLSLAQSSGRMFSAEEIYEWVWNKRAVDMDTVMVHIRSLRGKIEVDPKEPKYLKVVWGIGYKIKKQA